MVTTERLSIDPNAPDSLMSGAEKINANFDQIDSSLGYVQTEVARLHTRVDHDQANILGLAIELETLKGAILNNVSSNVYVETFDNLDDTLLNSGVYDAVTRKIVLK